LALPNNIVPHNFSRESMDHCTAPNKVLNLLVMHFQSDDASNRVVGDSNQWFKGDVAGEGDAGSLGSGGASPYLRHAFGPLNT
jgi:hypothetical protein